MALDPRSPPVTPGEVTVDAAALVDAPTVQWLVERLRECCAVVGRPVSRLSVRLIGDAEMDQLHQRHSGIAGTTDVLTFVECSEPVAADLAVCWDVAGREAAARGLPERLEALLYCLHGLLHACGWDDAQPEQAALMHKEQDRILSLIAGNASSSS